MYITIDANRREVSFGESRRRPDITHKFMDLDWPCNAAAPCSPTDYGLNMDDAPFAKLADKLA